MKNRTTAIKDGDGFHTVASLLLLVVNQPPRSGFSLADMRRRLPIIDKLETVLADDEIPLTPSEIVLVEELYRGHPWGLFHRDLVRIGDELKESAGAG